MRRYTVRSAGGAEREVEVHRVTADSVEAFVAGTRVQVAVVETPAGPILRLASGRIVRPEVRDLASGEMAVTWPGRAYVVARAQADHRGVVGTTESRARRVRAQMPGRVVKVLVRPGDSVTVGQGLVILEAMKMENEVKARRDGVIAAVRVGEGDRVETGADLVEFE